VSSRSFLTLPRSSPLFAPLTAAIQPLLQIFFPVSPPVQDSLLLLPSVYQTNSEVFIPTPVSTPLFFFFLSRPICFGWVWGGFLTISFLFFKLQHRVSSLFSLSLSLASVCMATLFLCFGLLVTFSRGLSALSVTFFLFLFSDPQLPTIPSRNTLTHPFIQSEL